MPTNENGVNIQRQYIGARYVIKIYENSQTAGSAEWEADTSYEPLTMVTYQNSSYLSKKAVPATIGNPAANTNYWVVTGAYNGQIATLQHQIDKINNTKLPEIESDILRLNDNKFNKDDVVNNLTTTVDGKALDARQGKVLNDLITPLKPMIISETNARELADANINQRIDALISPSGEAPSPAEITDARIGYNGVTYDTLGEAIREQVEYLSNGLTKNKVRLFPTFELGAVTLSGYNGNPAFITAMIKFSVPTKIIINGITARFSIYDNNSHTGEPIYLRIYNDSYVDHVHYCSPDYYYYITFGNTYDTDRERNGAIYIESAMEDKSEFNNIITNEGSKLPFSWVNGAVLSDGSFNNITTWIKTYFTPFEYDMFVKINVTEGYKAYIASYNDLTVSSFVERTQYYSGDIAKIEAGKFYVIAVGHDVGDINPDNADNYIILKKVSNFMPNSLCDKTVYGFGDSLMYGHYSGEGMITRLANAENMKFTNYAQNGGGIVDGVIAAQITNASASEPDFVIIDGLINDVMNADNYTTNLGTLANTYNDSDFVLTTFYGAFEHMLYLARTKYENSNIIFVCCHRTPSRDEEGQNILQEAARKCCEKWAIPYVDIYRHGQINCYLASMRNDYTYDTAGSTSGGNGTHLTGYGYAKWYAPQIKAKMLEISKP